MKHRIQYVIVTVVMVSMCTLPFGVTAHASAATSKTGVSTVITKSKDWINEQNKETKSKITDKFDDIKQKVDTKVEGIGNFLNLHLGDVGSVDVSTKDDVNVNISNSPVNVNININLININKKTK